MRTYTNLTWPDDPYRTSQQLYRRPSPVLAAVAVMLPGQATHTVLAAVAVTYLPLHRTRVLTTSDGTLAFGFRAVSAADTEEIRELVRLADLDLMQARRHARFLAGHQPPAQLRALREAAPGMVTRGLDAVEADWANRQVRERGAATLIDIGANVGNGTGDLSDACHDASVEASPASLTGHVALGGAAGDAVTAEHMAATAAERALVIALLCARHLDRYRWDGVLGTARVMAATTWDLFPHVTWDHTSYAQPTS
jgi:hypothetical protein